MSNILEFKRQEKPEPRASGAATCLDCKHQWAAIANAEQLRENDGWMECPACGVQKGRMRFPFAPNEGHVWQCRCGCELFYVQPDGVLCPNCGKMAEFP